MVKTIFNLPTDDSKIYKQLLMFLNFSLDATAQEREVLAEIIHLNNEYEALPAKQRAKFILSTDMRKEMREKLNIEEKQYNTVLSRVRKKKIFGEPIFDKEGILNKHLTIKPDEEGIQLEVNLINEIKVAPIKKEVEPKKEEQVTKPIPKVVDDHLPPPINGTANVIENPTAGFISLTDPDGE